MTNHLTRKSHVVIGGAGFLGRHLVRTLLQRGDKVSVVDISPYPAQSNKLIPECLVRDLSVATDKDFDEFIGNAEAVHHYAWSTIPQTANADPNADIKTNLGITIKVLDALKRRGGGQFIFPSSGGTVYGRLQIVPVNETHPLRPITAYGASKAAAELYCNVYRDLHGIDARVARLSNPFGPGQNPKRPQGVASTIIYRGLQEQRVELWGTGTIVRDFIHILDAVAGLVALVDAPLSDRHVLPVYNIGSGKGISINEIIETVERHLKHSITVERMPDRPFDVPTSVLDISKAKTELNWFPKLDFNTGIKRMITDLQEDPLRSLSSN